MSFIQFESAREKEKIRQELRDARQQMLEKAKNDAEQRAKRETGKILSGEANWMLPSVSDKIDKMSSLSSKVKRKKSKKSKSKQSKKASKKKKKKSSSSDPQSDSDDSYNDKSHKFSNKKLKKKRSQKETEASESDTSSESIVYSKKERKKQKKRANSNSDSDTSNEDDEWIEKPCPVGVPTQRDNWMTDTHIFKTYTREKSNKKVTEKQHVDTYDPVKSSRELNPYWKTSGTGLPSSFQKPRDESDDDDFHRNNLNNRNTSSGKKNWQKKTVIAACQEAERKVQKRNATQADSTSDSSSNEGDLQSAAILNSQVEQKSSTNTSSFLTDQQMNELGAKIIKAEILGNNVLVQQLKEKLENARASREQLKNNKQEKFKQGATKDGKSSDEHILLTRTDKKGNCRPLQQSKSINPNDLYGGRSGKNKAKQQRVETHVGGERVRYFADDDKYDIKQMFEREKYTSAADNNLEFANIASKNKNPNDDLEDIFADKIRSNISKEKTDKKELSRAIFEQKRLSETLDKCEKCFDSNKMDKKLLVTIGDNAYLALPWHVGLQSDHCVLVPTQHVSCSTQLDEDTWEEINDFRKALTKMFASQKKDVIFFEIANKLHRNPHLTIHCIPIREKDAEMAPFYFKKAIEESEREWSVNKQLVSLRNKSLRSSIPKGLPYFWVNFGMESGLAHVIEDQDRFPVNFAQEIIGGLLHLDPSKWRRPQKEHNIIAKVKMFADIWKKYDCTNK